MNSERLTDAEIRALGWQALVDTLGASGALRFALLTEHGYGDYAELRHRMLGKLSVNELLDRMRKDKRKARRAGEGGAPSKARRTRAGSARRGP